MDLAFALAQIMMPQHPRGDGAPWPPHFADGGELIVRRACGQLLDVMRGYSQSQIAMRPHIGPTHGHEQIDVGAPHTDALEFDQRRARRCVVPMCGRTAIWL